MSMESDLAADRALRTLATVEVLRQLNLFETMLQLYSVGEISALEKEVLENFYNPELQRKNYLLTNVIPSRGHFRGMQLLQQALKQSEQFEILNLLERAYKDAVTTIIAGEHFDPQEHNLGAGDPPQAASSNRCDSVSSINRANAASDPDTANNEDASGRESLGRFTSWSSSSPRSSQSSYEDPYDSASSIPQQQQQQHQPLSPTTSPSSSSSHIIIQVPFTQSTTVSVTPCQRKRSDHICYGSNPYKQRLEQNISVTINTGSQDEDMAAADNRVREETVRRVDRLMYSTMKFVIVGDTDTGKTSLLRRYISNKFSIDYSTSTLLDVQSTELACYNARYKLYLWDTAGQERFKALTKAYFRDAVGAFVVYDVTQRMSLDHCLQWKKEIDDVVQLSNGDPIPVVLIANKLDLGHLDGKQFSMTNGFTNYFETSAKTGVGIKEAVHFMVKKVHELSCASHESVVRTLSKNYSIKLHSHNDHSRKKCCTSSHQ